MNDKGKPPVTIKFLLDTVKSYQPDADLELIERAYLVAKEGHAGQTRASGEPYINHPLNVAAILTELQLDDKTIAAAILHDVVEDTIFTLDELKEMFGEEIALLIDGVTKIGQIYFKTKEQQQIEAYRKLIIATAKDLRVILIKLADRLHNMRTLKFVPESKRKRIAKETMELYAPLANRLGISNIKWELEDLSLRYLEPDIYYDLVEHVRQKRRERQIYISEAVRLIEEEFDELEIHASISGRAKHFYSIYKKMMRDHKDIGEIYDLSAVRILVDDVKDCYNVLGVIHTKWRPIPGRFKDYIAMPKSNGYRSLHTTVMALGYPLEIQIRTFDMHKISEYGVAAHWKYKESGSSKPANSDRDQKISWLRQIAKLQKEIKDPKEYLETLKLDFFSDEVFVFTPGRDLVVLPKGSCPIDFAYRIHTEVGHHCVGAKVNGRIVPLEYKLQNGDFVEVVTNRSNNGPSRDWLNIVAASDTRQKIRSWFKRENREENIAHGREMIETELKKLSCAPKDFFKENQLAEVARRMNMTKDDLLAGIGYGGTSAHSVVTKLIELHKKEIAANTPPDVSALLAEVKKIPERKKDKSEHGILVEGESGFFVRLAKCCNPIPGDEISGYITRGRGVSVHRADCPNILNGKSDVERMIEVSWDETSDKLYNVELEIVCEDKTGVLADLIAVPAEMKLNLHSIHAAPNRYNRTSTVKLGVEMSNAAQVDTLMNKLRRVESVYSVVRPMKLVGGD
ncbi:MAG: bifunctional (p)ppGpp synthetase/guanosine-3',5'-bis(diphosphate) 3'-pyrophosphohydrolase [Quinella sp. 3Q1]|nr:bifunctional (p)ppGpp synthetase/guanosine-3',5'-bis(diphosphate) 3'-pyrophosphohydrolase [Quinella sp. 3Q1]